MSGAYVTHEVEVGIDEFDDDDLIDEIKHRNLGHMLWNERDPRDIRQMVVDIQSYLCTHQDDKAHALMRELLKALLPPQIAAAHAFMLKTQYSEAICELDRFLEPSPAVTAKSVPKGKDETLGS